MPPGYRIECGAGNDPNTIRVTTPMGTTVQSIAGRGIPPTDSHGPTSAGPGPFQDRGNHWAQRSPEANFSTPTQNGGSLFVQAAAQSAQFDSAGRGGPPAPSSAGANAANARNNTHTPVPGSASSTINGQAANQANIERRGPVEFNHAISYVNKIKV